MINDEASSGGHRTNKFVILALVSLIIIFGISATYLLITFIQTDQTNENVFTQNYSNISSEQAYDLIIASKSENYNLTIIDCRGWKEGCGDCQFNNTGHIPGAELNENSLTLYNTTNDILVYSINGTVGAEFCSLLIGHVYGEIYNLEGGYEAWTGDEYPTQTVSEYSQIYFNISPKQAYELINTSKNQSRNLSIIDCRGWKEGCSVCQFNKGHILGAGLNDDPSTLYNTTYDLLVYSKNGTVGAWFCSELSGHVYGDIYNLAGGYEAWVAAYPNDIEKS